MKPARILTIVVLLLCLSFMASGAQNPVLNGEIQQSTMDSEGDYLILNDEDEYLKVNGEDVNSIILGAGQSCIIEVVSDDAFPYTDHVGFDDCNSLGIFTHMATMPEAGDDAGVTSINQSVFCGYRVATGQADWPDPGVHFVFEYVAKEIGETDLKLYDYNFSQLDAVHITVIPAEVGTAFTYQGRLIDDNRTPYGEYDFKFELYNAPIDSDQEGDTVYIDEKEVEDGIFTVELDFGTDVFAGETRWLQIGVRPGELEDPSEYTTLEPRQKVTPTPYALYAKTAGETTSLLKGIVVMWSGSIETIPSGWSLCDGTNGTPDLRDRFIVGAGSSYSVDDTGGEAFHTLTIDEMPAHNHAKGSLTIGEESGHTHPLINRGATDGFAPFGGGSGDGSIVNTGAGTPHTHSLSGSVASTGGGSAHENRPPYYALAYIMKL